MTGCTVAPSRTSRWSATGVYWKPVWHLLEDSFELVLANASHIKAGAGPQDGYERCDVIADPLAHGLIRASFRPANADPRACATSRAHASSWSKRRTRYVQRIQKVLEDANLKIGR